MVARHAVRTIVLSSGERLPVLVSRSDGLPLFEPAIYALTQLRQTNVASATIERALRELVVLLDFLAFAGISLDERLHEGRLLTIGEIDSVVRHCRLPTSQLHKLHEVQSTPRYQKSVTALEPHRMRQGSRHFEEVASATAYNRISTIRRYLAWMVDHFLGTNSPSEAVRVSLTTAKEQALAAFSARRPKAKGRNIIEVREGASPETVKRLLEVIDPASPENPWQHGFARARNALAIHWLWKLGLRRGELLNIKIGDIDFLAETVTIARRPDDPEDPRKEQPKVKTRERILPLGAYLAQATDHYITQIRSRINGSWESDFLLVAEGSGRPLTCSGQSKVFRTLRANCPWLSRKLTAHVLRHTWNDDFSEKMDAEGVPEEAEKRMRAYLMGWSETSSSAEVYTRRTQRKRAQKASLEMQASMMGVANGK